MSEVSRAFGSTQKEAREGSGERALFLAVISQAIADATSKEVQRNVTVEARDWLTQPSRDLAYVCDCAGIEMDRLIRFAKMRISPSSAPEPALTFRRKRYGRYRERRLTFRGRTMNVAQWAYEIGVAPCTITARLASGWSVEQTLSTPKNKRVRRQHGLTLEGGGGVELSPDAQGPAPQHHA